MSAEKTYNKRIDISSSGLITAQCWTRRDFKIVEKIFEIFGAEFNGYRSDNYTINNYKFPWQMEKDVQEILKTGDKKFFIKGFGYEIQDRINHTIGATIHYYDKVNHTYNIFICKNGKYFHSVTVSKYDEEEE